MPKGGPPEIGGISRENTHAHTDYQANLNNEPSSCFQQNYCAALVGRCSILLLSKWSFPFSFAFSQYRPNITLILPQWIPISPKPVY